MCSFPAFIPTCFFSFLFVYMLIFLLYLLSLFHFFIPYFIFLCATKCAFIAHSDLECAFTAHFGPAFSYFLCYFTSPQPLVYFSKLHPKCLSNIPLYPNSSPKRETRPPIRNTTQQIWTLTCSSKDSFANFATNVNSSTTNEIPLP